MKWSKDDSIGGFQRLTAANDNGGERQDEKSDEEFHHIHA